MNRDEAESTIPTQVALEGLSRRIGRVHYALAESGRVDTDLQRWCLDELMAALEIAEQARRGEGVPAT